MSYLKYCLLPEQTQCETKCTIWVQTGCAWSLAKGVFALPYWKVHLCGCGRVVSWERWQCLLDFVPCHNLLASALLTCGELTCQLKFQDLWVVWLRAEYLWSNPTYLPGLHTLLLPISAGTEQQDMALAVTAAWNSMGCGSPLPNYVFCTEMVPGASFLLCFPFLIVLLLPWTHSSVQSTTLRNHSAHRCCDKTFLVILYGNSGLQLCKGAVTLLTCPCG